MITCWVLDFDLFDPFSATMLDHIKSSMIPVRF